MFSFTKEELKSHQDANVCYICGKRILKKVSKNINYRKVRDHCHYTGKYRVATHSVCNLKFYVPNEISVVFHSASNYNYYFIIKELANEFEGQFECLGDNTKKYKTFSVPIEKEVTKIDKDGHENFVTIYYKIKFIDTARFMATSLSNLVDDLTERIYKVKCKDCDYFLEYESVKDDLIKCKCLSCNKDFSNKIDEELKERFKDTFEFSNNGVNKFILLLRKGVYPYEYMNDWENFNETILPEKHELHNDLPFLPEIMKLGKVEKLVTNLHDKTDYVIHIRNLKQILNHGLILKTVHRLIKFNQKAWLKPYIDMNTKLRQKGKNNFEKDFVKLMNNAVFRKTMENVTKHRNIKLVTTKRRRNHLVSEQNYHTTNLFTENLLAIEMRKTQILINKPVYLSL